MMVTNILGDTMPQEEYKAIQINGLLVCILMSKLKAMEMPKLIYFTTSLQSQPLKKK